MRYGFRSAIIGLAVVLGTAGLAAAPAEAADRNGAVEPNEFAFLYLSKSFTQSIICAGSLSDFATAKKTLDGYKFLGAGQGKGQLVKNNATCAYGQRDLRARVYYNSYCQGDFDEVRPYKYTDLNNTWNDNASFKWLNTFNCNA